MGVHTTPVGASSTTRTLSTRLADMMIRTVYSTGKELDDVVATVTAGTIRSLTNRSISDVDVEVIKHLASNIASQEIA